MKFFWLLLLGSTLPLSPRVAAQAPQLALRQLNHRVFSTLDGAPTDISALAQTPDGTLWLAGRTGLARFDGIRFVRYPAEGEQPLGSTNLASLFVASDGALWISTRPGGVIRLKDGQVTRFAEAQGLPPGTVEQFAQERDGTLWLNWSKAF